MRIPRKNNGNNAEVRIDVACNLYKNGVLVGTFHNSITNFDWFGKRFFASSGVPAPALYQVVRTTHANGNFLGLATISKVSNGVYKTSRTYVNQEALATIWQWTGGWVQFANSADEAYKVAAGTWSVNWTGGDTLVQEFIFTVTGAGLTDAGKENLAYRIFYGTTGTGAMNAVAVYNYVPFINTINPATYAAVSATIHTLSFRTTRDLLANSLQIWDNQWGASSYIKTFRDFRVYKSSIQEVIQITLSQS